MKKIVSLFQRNYDTDRLVRDELVPGAEWVANGEGVATRKWDGACTMIRDGQLFKRFEAKGEHLAGIKPLPAGWERADDRDATTDKQMGWAPVRADEPADCFMVQAFNARHVDDREDGTYEFLGPKSQGNVEGFSEHRLVRHRDAGALDAPRTFDALRAFLADHDDIEGIVWHHPDGRMVKIKGKDFGIKRRKTEVVHA